VSRFIDRAHESLTFASAQNEESDFAAERRWENDGGNPGQLEQLPCDDRKEGHNRSGARRVEGILLPRLTTYAFNPIPRNNARC
jgi:hypothetical protein